MKAHQDHVVVEQLRIALEQGRVPSRHRVLGTQLLDQLSDAVRIVVLGRPGSGKSSLINLLLGENVLGSMPGLEIAEIAYGPEPKVYLEWSNGTTHTVDGVAVEPNVSDGAYRARYELPDEKLIAQSYFEICQPSDPDRQTQLFNFAVETGQVFVWCSERFDDAELAIWRAAPDAVKDHSFLALTMADRQLMRGSLTQRIEELDEVVSEEFLSLHPIATLHALAARADGSARSDLWDSSGGRDLLEAITAQVRFGRAEELDKATMLVAQFGELADDKGRGSKPKSQSGSTSIELDHSSALDHFRARLSAAAEELASDIDGERTPDATEVINKCVNALQDLTATLEEASGDDINIDSLLEEARDGEEMLMLLQVEQGPKAAEDAVFLMLQLKKEAFARAQL